MADPGPGGLRDLSRALRSVSDEKILKVTRMIDLLPERGAADLLLEPLRPRLVSLRPPRRMTPMRRLFTPFDAVMVPAMRWKPDDLTLPRSVIQPVMNLIAADPPALSAVDCEATDEAGVTRGCAALWFHAGSVLARAEIPEHWHTRAWQTETGLTAASIASLLPVLRIGFQNAAILRVRPSPDDPDHDAALGRLLVGAAAVSPLAWGIVLAMLLATNAPDRVMMAAARLVRCDRQGKALGITLDRALQDTVERLSGASSPLAADDALTAELVDERLALTCRLDKLRRLENRPPEEQRRINRICQDFTSVNRLLFERTLQARLLAPDARGPADGRSPNDPPPADPDAAVGTLEAEAYQLRRLALGARRVGDGEYYDRMLHQAAARLIDAGAGPMFLTPVDRLRLTELLIGSEEAARALITS